MEQVCKICKNGIEDKVEDEKLMVLILCENCLRSDNLSPLLDQLFS